MKTRLAFIGCLLFGVVARAEPPPFSAEISAWAQAAGYRLAPFSNCRIVDEQRLGARGSVCWAAKQRAARPAGSGMFPRVEITLSVYGTAEEARARMARFREPPAGVVGEVAKAYPLRAGFRVGERVIIVKTDAVAFEQDAARAAVELSKRLGGADLTCWGACPSS